METGQGDGAGAAVGQNAEGQRDGDQKSLTGFGEFERPLNSHGGDFHEAGKGSRLV